MIQESVRDLKNGVKCEGEGREHKKKAIQKREKQIIHIEKYKSHYVNIRGEPRERERERENQMARIQCLCDGNNIDYCRDTFRNTPSSSAFKRAVV